MRDTVDLAREAAFAVDVSTDPNSPPSWRGAGHCDRFKAFEALVRADEREACAKACKQIGQHGIITQCVNAIRARGQA